MKMRRLGAEWFALFAGMMSDAEEFLDLLRQELIPIKQDVDDASITLSIGEMMHKLRTAGLAFRRAKMHAYLIARAGLSLDEFERKRDSRARPSEYEARLTTELENLQCPVSVILTGFCVADPFMFHFGNWDFGISHHFCAIGEGAYMATPMLNYRKQAERDSLGVTLYKVFEAKRLSEVYNSVGHETTMCVLAPDLRLEGLETSGIEEIISAELMFVMPEGMNTLEEILSRVGPSSIPESGFDIELGLVQKSYDVPNRPEPISDASGHRGSDT